LWPDWFFWVDGFTFISDLCIVTVLPVGSITNNLSTSIREQSLVFTLDYFTITLSAVREVVTIIVLHGVSEVVWHSRFMLTVRI
jgi:hypothetical protein